MTRPQFSPIPDLTDLQREAVSKLLADDGRLGASLVAELVEAGLVALAPTRTLDGKPAVGVVLTETGAARKQ